MFGGLALSFAAGVQPTSAQSNQPPTQRDFTATPAWHSPLIPPPPSGMQVAPANALLPPHGTIPSDAPRDTICLSRHHRTSSCWRTRRQAKWRTGGTGRRLGLSFGTRGRGASTRACRRPTGVAARGASTLCSTSGSRGERREEGKGWEGNARRYRCFVSVFRGAGVPLVVLVMRRCWSSSSYTIRKNDTPSNSFTSPFQRSPSCVQTAALLAACSHGLVRTSKYETKLETA